MVDDDIKKLLLELHMGHYVQELEQCQSQNQCISQPLVQTQIVQQKIAPPDFHEEDDQLSQELLQKQVKAVNSILVGKKRMRKMLAVCVLLLVVGGAGYFGMDYYFQKAAEVTIATVEVKPNELQEVQDIFAKMMAARKTALKTCSDEMHALIASHAEKKLESFASKLTHLTAKCQAIDEEHSLKIAQEIKVWEKKLKDQHSEELLQPFAQLVTALQ